MVNGSAGETLLASTGGGGSNQEDAAFDRTVEALQGIVLGARTHTALHGTHHSYSSTYARTASRAAVCRAHVQRTSSTACTRGSSPSTATTSKTARKTNTCTWTCSAATCVHPSLPTPHCTHTLFCCADGHNGEVPRGTAAAASARVHNGCLPALPPVSGAVSSGVLCGTLPPHPPPGSARGRSTKHSWTCC